MADPSATPLSNQDFRKLLSTPRADRFPAQSNATPIRTPARADDSRGGPAKSKKPFKPRTLKAVSDEKKEDDGEPKYRDRAEERRKGINSDYESANNLSSVLTGDSKKLSVEESKYLGGDMEHTHMVKGLDYALLHRERAKMVYKAQEEGASETAKLNAAASAAAAAAAKVSSMGKEAMAAAAAAAASLAMGSGKEEALSFHGPMARQVHGLLFKPLKNSISDMFGHQRMAFVYNVSADEEGPDMEIPTTLRRSKADCPLAVESVFASLEGQVLERIVKIMSYVKATAGGKKLKKKEREELFDTGSHTVHQQQQQTNAAAPARGHAPAATHIKGAAGVEQEEDIFGDAGTDYKPSMSNDKKKKDSKGSGSYFGDEGESLPPPPPGPTHRGGDDMEIEDGETAPPPPPPSYGVNGPLNDGYINYQALGVLNTSSTYGMATASGGMGAGISSVNEAEYRGPAFRSQQEREEEEVMAAKWRVRASKAEQREVDYEENDYAECYPLQAGFGGEVVDSDEEDLSHMDTTKGKSRYDFTTEEEWERYKMTREQAPKAAFQFGVKTADGRRQGGAKNVEKVKEGKFSSQLSKIERLLQEKGHDHTAAFKKPVEGGKESGGYDPSLTPARGKRQRI
ncbi:hypothetical protein CEUSTIGMA_g6234.t1 [Chlamydomonas eustigma]|uniref:RED-like N-terminal domain-containing protein n=1 Tax=Chlamydomonas eustigma TaxID=1157962 RepID=A0A250X6V1_9CHLO|nr:hypothetical protein CEUSTIGMA_g6234.t1 [Chlamydomonas eustigma]|eukprot:GAX78797.1 hypothetical protein CEUSTIGMA_g6234.t1 [Chlamydomonas eustigma]